MQKEIDVLEVLDFNLMQCRTVLDEIAELALELCELDYRGNEDEYAYYGRLVVRDFELLCNFSGIELATSIVWIVEKKRKVKSLQMEKLASTAGLSDEIVYECGKEILLLEQNKLFAEECATLTSLK